MPIEKDSVRKTLEYIKRREHTPDLNSFVATVENGRAFVAYHNKKFCVTCYRWIGNTEETLEYQYDKIEDCHSKLLELKIKPETIEI